MIGRPQPNEAASYYSTYIDRVTSDDIVAVLTAQLDETVAFLSAVSEEQSLQRYAPDRVVDAGAARSRERRRTRFHVSRDVVCAWL